MSAIDLNGEHIIEDCKQVIVFLKEKLVGLKEFVLSVPFSNEAEEIDFFKYKKPALLARLMYFYKVLHIESNRPPCAELWDDFYRKIYLKSGFTGRKPESALYRNGIKKRPESGFPG